MAGSARRGADRPARGGAGAGRADERQRVVALPRRAQRSLVCANMARFAAAWDYRCAAHAYRMACAGHCHLLFYSRLMPWDHAPGWLLHQEAGGYSALLDGIAYTPLHTGGGLICAPDRHSWEAVRDALVGDRTAGHR